jgi:hypothetical protein
MSRYWIVKRKREWIEVTVYYVVGMAVLMSLMVLATQ